MSINLSTQIPAINDQMLFQTLVTKLKGTQIGEVLIGTIFPVSIPWKTMNLREIIEKIEELDKWFLAFISSDTLRKQYKWSIENQIDPHYEKAYNRLIELFPRAVQQLHIHNAPNNIDQSNYDITIDHAKDLSRTINYYFKSAYKSNQLADVSALLEAGADINSNDNDGVTALMHAAMKKNFPLAELLLKNGANANSADIDGETALMFAADAMHVDLAQLLLDYGAKINAMDSQGRTALSIARENYRETLERGHHEEPAIIPCLLKALQNAHLEEY